MVTKEIKNGRCEEDFALDTSYFKLVKHESRVHELPEGVYSSQAEMQVGPLPARLRAALPRRRPPFTPPPSRRPSVPPGSACTTPSWKTS